MDIQINYLGVLLAGVVFMIIGFLWYGPLFGKPWMKEKGYTKESLKEAQSKMGKLYGVSFVVSLFTAFVLSHVMTLSTNFYDYTPLTTGLSSAFWMWLGFIMPVQVTHTIFGDGNWKVLAIDTSYQLVAILAMGVVLSYV